jgi:hypothetical protein
VRNSTLKRLTATRHSSRTQNVAYAIPLGSRQAEFVGQARDAKPLATFHRALMTIIRCALLLGRRPIEHVQHNHVHERDRDLAHLEVEGLGPSCPGQVRRHVAARTRDVQLRAGYESTSIHAPATATSCRVATRPHDLTHGELRLMPCCGARMLTGSGRWRYVCGARS